ncbi:hypothetical protein BH10ACI2_BH10ACI2_21310 [soil metagenome]
MAKSRRLFGALNRRAFLLTGVIFTLCICGFVSWRAGARNRAEKPDLAKSVVKSGPVQESQTNVPAKEDPDIIQLNAGAIDTRALESKTIARSIESFSGKKMQLVKFAGPIQPEWYAMLQKQGLEIVDYIPNYAYLVYGDATSSNKLMNRAQLADSPITWVGDYTAEQRIQPNAYVRTENKANAKTALAAATSIGSPTGFYRVQLFQDDITNTETLSDITAIQTEAPKKTVSYLHYVVTTVGLTPEGVKEIAKRPDVVSIDAYVEPVKLDERQDMILAGNLTGNGPTPGNYLTYLANRNLTQAQFTTSGFAVNVSDSGIDNATTAPSHFSLYKNGTGVAADSRLIFSRLFGTPNTGSSLQGCDGHGNLNSEIIGGFVPTGTVDGVNFAAAPHADATGFRYGLGVAPFVKLGSSVIFDPDSFTSPTYQNLESQAYRDGSRISSNSWGSNSNAYSVDSQQYDALVRDAQPDTGCLAPNCISTPGNQQYVIVFAAGNKGSGANTVGEPSTGKNVISVGASENVQAFGGADACAVGDTDADNINDLIGFSSRGPTSDGRKKPDIVAPGTHVTGGVPQASLVLPAGSGTGAQSSCFTANGVCGGVGVNFFPAAQQYYTASSGTSHSTPAISGEAALIRQDFINRGLEPPSPAMTKALMLNSARYMNGSGANDTLPSNNQGMGEMNLNSYFSIFDIGRSLHDQTAGDTFTASGQQRVITGNISDTTKPLKVTVAWTDAPGATTGSAAVNNLDLEVTVGGVTYLGNVFSGANSTSGGTADPRNNVESVFIPAGVTGSLVIKVKATNIAGDGIPNNAQPLDQDYALVATNITEAPLAVVSAGATAITAESCSPANNAIDQSETVTINFGLSNIGTANTTNLVATLLPTGGVTTPSGPQSFGPLTANGAGASKAFTFTAGTNCGQALIATFQLQDGATNLGNVTFRFNTGSLTVPVTGTYSSGNIAAAIPDNDPTGVDVPIAIADTGLVSDINVRVRLNHTFDGDVALSLVSPTGVVVPLIANRGGGGANFGSGSNDCSGTHTIFDDGAALSITGGVSPFTGSFRPESPLSGFNGLSVNGTWKLRAVDNAADDVGTIGCVQLEVSRQQFACCGVAGVANVVSAGAAILSSENYAPLNNTPDPGETLTVNLPVVNAGTGNTANLTGTLQAMGGVTNPSSPQSYGVVVAGGAVVTRPFTFVAAGNCGDTITLTLALQDGAANLGNVTYSFRLGTVSNSSLTFSNTAAITIPAIGTGASTGSPATPYPSNITVSAAPAVINRITVSINNYSHAFPDDVDLLLVSPTGRKMIILSDAGSSTLADGLNITLDDNAAAPVPDGTGIASGTFKPANYSTIQDPFPSPAPTGPFLSPATGGTETLASAFTGAAGGDPNGVWSLYVVDDGAADVGAITGGWSLSLTTSTNVCSIPVSAVEVSGRVFTPDNRGLSGARVVLTDSAGNSRNVTTSTFGFFRFDGVQTGGTYTVRPSSKRYRFETQTLLVNGALTSVNFVGQE